MSNTSNKPVVLSCRKLSKHYRQGHSDIQVLNNINLDVKRGERLAIVGSSGSGKSTLLNMLGGLDSPTHGSVTLAGQAFDTLNENARGELRNQHLGFVYQFHHLLAEFSALENTMMPLLIARVSRKQARAVASELLTAVGLAERLNHKPSELSGGERQRVAIARAVAMKPQCVLMDEPTGNLDQHTAKKTQDLLFNLNKELGISFVIVTHDMTLAKTLDRVLTLDNGCLNE